MATRIAVMLMEDDHSSFTSPVRFAVGGHGRTWQLFSLCYFLLFTFFLPGLLVVPTLRVLCHPYTLPVRYYRGGLRR